MKSELSTASAPDKPLRIIKVSPAETSPLEFSSTTR